MILGYGVFKLFQPQPEWVPMILGLLIMAFSVSLMAKSRPERGIGPMSDFHGLEAVGSGRPGFGNRSLPLQAVVVNSLQRQAKI